MGVAGLQALLIESIIFSIPFLIDNRQLPTSFVFILKSAADTGPRVPPPPWRTVDAELLDFGGVKL
jgi:hypothetical protein